MKTDTTTPAAAPRHHADERAAAIALNLIGHGAKTLNRDIAARVYRFLRARPGVIAGQHHPRVHALDMGTSLFLFTELPGHRVMVRWEDLAKGSAPGMAA